MMMQSVALGACLMLLLAGVLSWQGTTSPSAALAAVSSSDPVIAAAGDIACDLRPNAPPGDDTGPRNCHMSGTYAALQSVHPLALLTLGDEQYDSATYEQFISSYDKTWGRLKNITHPVPGNHEYDTPGAAGYYRYFGAAAGPTNKGYYSFNIAGWHLIAINANCDAIGGCQKGSPQERWLATDLATHPAACTLAFWHQPRFSSGPHHSDATFTDLWSDLYEAKSDVVLGGHDHDYERFGPQTPAGAADPRNGIREFIVGTGGRSHYAFKNIEPNSETRSATTFGILALTLHPHGYSWRFVPEAGSQFSDSGSQSCHGRG